MQIYFAYMKNDLCGEIQRIPGSYVKKYFPLIPPHHKEVGNYALASVVYHSKILSCDMLHNHSIFNTQLFIDLTELEKNEKKCQVLCPRYQCHSRDCSNTSCREYFSYQGVGK